MSGFLRTLVYGLAAIGIILLAGGTTVLMKLKSGGVVSPEKLREYVLSAEERAFLATMHARKPEPAEVERAMSLDEEELIAHLAEVANAQRASQLVAELKRDKASLAERRLELDRQAGAIAEARADLARARAALDDQLRSLDEKTRSLDRERASWAAKQADALKTVSVLGSVEAQRLRDQVTLFLQMKDAAWQSLRRFEPREIARYLVLMAQTDPKKAARMLVLAQADADYPSLAQSVQREMLRIDVDGKSGDHIARLAALYQHMPADQVLTALATSSSAEIAEMLTAMQTAGASAKQRAAILEGLRARDPAREIEVQRILSVKPVPPAANANGLR